jgi:hypothetical protein
LASHPHPCGDPFSMCGQVRGKQRIHPIEEGRGRWAQSLPGKATPQLQRGGCEWDDAGVQILCTWNWAKGRSRVQAPFIPRVHSFCARRSRSRARRRRPLGRLTDPPPSSAALCPGAAREGGRASVWCGCFSALTVPGALSYRAGCGGEGKRGPSGPPGAASDTRGHVDNCS